MGVSTWQITFFPGGLHECRQLYPISSSDSRGCSIWCHIEKEHKGYLGGGVKISVNTLVTFQWQNIGVCSQLTAGQSGQGDLTVCLEEDHVSLVELASWRNGRASRYERRRPCQCCGPGLSDCTHRWLSLPQEPQHPVISGGRERAAAEFIQSFWYFGVSGTGEGRTSSPQLPV